MMRTSNLLFAVVVGLAGGVASIGTAQAQASECQKFQGLLQERQALVGRLNSGGKARQVSPQVACSTLQRLVSNGQKALAFLDVNKDWCQIPDAFVENMKADNARASTLRGQACKAASQQAAAIKQAREAQARQQQGQGGFGGSDSITGGAWRVPQGAL